MNTQETFEKIMSGTMRDDEIKSVLTRYRDAGISAADLMSAATAMRGAGVKVRCDNPDAVDIVGTGGDLAGTFNVSTTAAFIAAGAGVTIAKHGNRAATSKCGTADVLEALGYDLATPPETIAEMIERDGIGFLFARTLHPAMRYVANARKSLKFKTIFNYLGPLTNPADVKQHVIGVADSAMVRPFAEALEALGSRSALVVCGDNGLDEISTEGVTRFAMLRDGIVSEGEIDIAKIYGKTYDVREIAGGNPEENAMILRGVLNGGLRGAYRMAAVINAAAAIWIADKARSLAKGIEVAEESIDSGKALAKLETFLGGSGVSPLLGGTSDTPLSGSGKMPLHPNNNILAQLSARRREDSENAAGVRDFAAAFSGPGIHIIAELKKASPSKGLIRPGFNPGELAKELAASGAAALSVLAEPHKFLGSEEYVRTARNAADVPVLYKDFVTTPYQVLRARAAGADAVLLIAAVLGDAALADLLSCVRGYGMEALVETHTEEEIDRAVKAGAKIIGVNCRDLKTFRTDPSITAGLLRRIPDGCVKIAESGIRNAGDIAALRAAGADGFLVGETLMRAERPGDELRKLSTIDN